MKIVMNGVPVAPHGPIFGQNEAYHLQEAFLNPSHALVGPFWAPKRPQQSNIPKIMHLERGVIL